MKVAGETITALSLTGRAFPITNKAVMAYIIAADGATKGTKILKGSLSAFGTVIEAHPILAATAIFSIIGIVNKVKEAQKEAQQKAVGGKNKTDCLVCYKSVFH